MAFRGKSDAAKRRAPKERQPLDEQALYSYAVYTLGRKMRTVAELKRLMRRRVEPGESGEAKMHAVVARLMENKYLDDARYAADYTRMRQENERFGRRRVQQDLMQRGVKSEIAGAALDVAYAEVQEVELARRYIERKRLRKPTNDKETARIVRSLVRAGFSLRTIFPLLKSWDVNAETIEALSDIEPERTE
jgi:regulatory protein